MGYRVVAKPLKRMPDGNIKASMDMDYMAAKYGLERPRR